MSKKKKAKKKTKRVECSPATKKAIAKLKADYFWGVELNENMPASKTYADKAVETIAEEKGVSTSLVRKCRQLAYTYSVDQLEALFEQMRKHDRAIGTTHFFLFASADPKFREKLERDTIKNGWSCRRVSLELRKKYGTRKLGGKRKDFKKDTASFRVELASLSRAWKRLVDVNEKPNKNDELSLEHLNLGRDVIGKINEAYWVVDELLEMIDKPGGSGGRK